MRIHLIRPQDLSASLIRQWYEYQDTNASLSSPYFDPMFAVLAAEAGRNAQIAVIEDGNDTVGFFPFETTSGMAGQPVAGPLSDFHGAITGPGTTLSVEQLISRSGLKSWAFDHLVDLDRSFNRFIKNVSPSPAMDLRAGFDAYATAPKLKPSKKLTKLKRQRRQLERDFDVVRFEPLSSDLHVLRKVMELKSAQFLRADLVDIFSFSWVVDFIDRIFNTKTPRFWGALSTLYAGETLIAAHMGMCSQHVWHYWFPVYNRDYSKYSPGLLLLLHIIEEAAVRGLCRVDLGKGDDAYKYELANTAISVAQGKVSFPSRFAKAYDFTGRSLMSLFRSPLFRATSLDRPARMIVKYWRKQKMRRKLN